MRKQAWEVRKSGHAPGHGRPRRTASQPGSAQGSEPARTLFSGSVRQALPPHVSVCRRDVHPHDGGPPFSRSRAHTPPAYMEGLALENTLVSPHTPLTPSHTHTRILRPGPKLCPRLQLPFPLSGLFSAPPTHPDGEGSDPAGLDSPSTVHPCPPPPGPVASVREATLSWQLPEHPVALPSARTPPWPPACPFSQLTQESGNVHAALGGGWDYIPGSRSDGSRGNSGLLLPGLHFLQLPPPLISTPPHRAFESDLTAVAPGPAQGLLLLPVVLRFKSGLVSQGGSLLFCPHQKHPALWALSRSAPRHGHLSLHLAGLLPRPRHGASLSCRTTPPA